MNELVRELISLFDTFYLIIVFYWPMPGEVYSVSGILDDHIDVQLERNIIKLSDPMGFNIWRYRYDYSSDELTLYKGVNRKMVGYHHLSGMPDNEWMKFIKGKIREHYSRKVENILLSNK